MTNRVEGLHPVPLLSAVDSVSTGAPKHAAAARRVVQATVTGTGAVSATVLIYGSIDEPTDETDMVLLGTITLSGTNKDTDGFAFDAPWPWLLADLTAISGTGAAVTTKVGL